MECLRTELWVEYVSHVFYVMTFLIDIYKQWHNMWFIQHFLHVLKTMFISIKNIKTLSLQWYQLSRSTCKLHTKSLMWLGSGTSEYSKRPTSLKLCQENKWLCHSCLTIQVAPRFLQSPYIMVKGEFYKYIR